MLFELLTLSYTFIVATTATGEDFHFAFNGFRSANLTLDGVAKFTSSSLLALTNGTQQKMGHAFYSEPVTFKTSPSSSAISFSTTFVFGIIPQYPTLSGHGIAFVVAPTRGLPGALPSQYLGLFNGSNNGNDTNHVFAIELDTIYSTEFKDINNNHVGIDINGLISAAAEPAGYFSNSNGQFHNLSLFSGKAMQVWVEYDGKKGQIEVTIAPLRMKKPSKPLLSLKQNLTPVLNQTMYVGFSSSTGSVDTSHYISGWSFRVNGKAEDLDVSDLPKLPRIGPNKIPKFLTNELPLICLTAVFGAIAGGYYYRRRKVKFGEVREDWERDYGPHRFKYKDLNVATKGFKEKGLLGTGGFGRVYRGVLLKSKMEIAVKRVSHESHQGMKEFVAEIVSIGRMRHRNLVQLLGYCRRKGELLLVYEYMPNGSLDKFLYDEPRSTLNWYQRFRIIKGVASGLFYLHEGWEKVVVHRDIKASNVLVDGELNGRLGDFGLARLYDHGSNPQTTHVVGTLGYLAPEHTRTGKATTSTDVYAFGAFLLEVACGRRPIQPWADDDLVFIDWVFSLYSAGEILEAIDPRLGRDYVREEAELVLKLGLLCSQSEPQKRPSMRQVIQFLEGDLLLPDLISLGISAAGLTFARNEGFDDFILSYPSSMNKDSIGSSSVAESLLSTGKMMFL
ncbi:Non-specific serine/threonine protein kinase [Bertholletia excelsa]